MMEFDTLRKDVKVLFGRIGALVLFTIIGTLWYHYYEKWTIIDCFYFTITTGMEYVPRTPSNIT